MIERYLQEIEKLSNQINSKQLTAKQKKELRENLEDKVNIVLDEIIKAAKNFRMREKEWKALEYIKDIIASERVQIKKENIQTTLNFIAVLPSLFRGYKSAQNTKTATSILNKQQTAYKRAEKQFNKALEEAVGLRIPHSKKLETALLKGDREQAEKLIADGAILNTKTKNGKKAFDVAKDQCQNFDILTENMYSKGLLKESPLEKLSEQARDVADSTKREMTGKDNKRKIRQNMLADDTVQSALKNEMDKESNKPGLWQKVLNPFTSKETLQKRNVVKAVKKELQKEEGKHTERYMKHAKTFLNR